MLTIDNTNTKKLDLKMLLFPAFLLVLFVSFFLVLSYKAGALSKTKTAWDNVYIENIDVSGKTKAQILSLLQEEYFIKDTAKFSVGNKKIKLSQIDASYDYETVANQAICYGKSGGIFKKTFDYIAVLMDKKVLPMSMTAKAKDIDNIVDDLQTQKINFYKIDEKELLLKIDYAKIGSIIDKEETIINIKKALANNALSCEIAYIKDASKHADELMKVLAVKPKDASYRRLSQKSIEIKKEKNGIAFDKKRFKAELKRRLNFTIPIELTKPKLTKEKLEKKLFSTKMSTYTTYFNTGQVSRVTNIRLASSFIDGTILLPGEEFSFNKIVGQRTAQNGFRVATIYSAGQVTEGVGGGICQASTTMYNAVLKADLKVSQRKNHQFTVSYVPAGQDATVSYGAVDFRFRNSTSSPIKINLKCSGGSITASFLGATSAPASSVSNSTIAVRPPKIESKPNPNKNATTTVIEQAGHTGYTVDTYKTYTKTGKRVFLHRSVYNAQTRVILTPTKKEEKPKKVEKKSEKKKTTNNKKKEQKPRITATPKPTTSDTQE